jgi:inhibitor of cysteine peptidase
VASEDVVGNCNGRRLMAEIAVGEGHNGASVAAKVGDHIVVRLPENPTTGFRWSGQPTGLDLLQLESDEFAQGASGAVGGGGVRVLRYRATGAGRASLSLELARPWETNAPRSQFRIEVSVGQ